MKRRVPKPKGGERRAFDIPLSRGMIACLAQAGAYCGMTARSLEDLRYRKAGPAFSKVGGRIVRYRRADLDAWLLAGREA